MASHHGGGASVNKLLLFGLVMAISGTMMKLGVAAQGDANAAAIFDSLLAGYDKRVRPDDGGPPVTVGVTMYILSVRSFSDKNMDFTVDMYFRQFWQDSRLSFTPKPGLEKLVFGAEEARSIWIPDTFFVNEKSAYSHKVTTENELLRILHDGQVLRSVRLTITASCPMDLRYFPMDQQLCRLEMESFRFSMKDIRYEWKDGKSSAQISTAASPPLFEVLGHRQSTIEASLTTGNYSRLMVEILFARNTGYYITHIYIPSILIVIVSWVSFWLRRSAIPTRVGLTVAALLTSTVLMIAINMQLPKTSYIKAIDIHLGFCFLQIFASLLETVIIGYIASKRNNLDGDNMEESGTARIGEEKNPEAKPEGSKFLRKLLIRITPASIDRYSRIAFPATMACFIFFYWIVYPYQNDEVEGLNYLFN